MQHILVIHGPNLDVLGKRKPEIYGRLSLHEINAKIENFAKENKMKVTIIQSNSEREIIDAIHSAENFDGIIINPAGYTHTSVVIRDAVEAISIPTIEVHISNIYAREEFRQQSIVAPVCEGQISGLGWLSYLLAMEYFMTSGARK